MIFHIEGEDYEVSDEEIRARLDEQDGEAEESNKYIFGIHVHHTSELDAMGDDIAKFMSKVGEGVVEVQVSVNAKLAATKDMVVGFDVSHLHVEQLQPAIGDVEYDDDDYDDYDDEEDDE